METNSIICCNFADILPQIPENSIDATIFSPPYDSIRTYKGFIFDYKLLGRELYRVTKDGGMCCCVIGDGTKDFAKSMTSFRLAVDWVDNAGWKLFETVVYARDGRPGKWWNQRYRVDHEYVHIFFKGDRPNHFDKEHLKVPAKHAGETWHGTTRLTDGSLVKNEPKVCGEKKCRGTIWHYKTSNTEHNLLKMQHPATFPEALASDLIRCFTKEGDIILDPTCGSGTTCVAAAQYNRKYIGIDISEEYVQLAKNRIKAEVITNILEV